MSGNGPVDFRVASDKPFLIGLGVLGGSYLLIIVAMVLADLFFLNYADKPVLGNEMVRQGRHAESGVAVPVEPGRRYFFVPEKTRLAYAKPVASCSGPAFLRRVSVR